MTALSEIVLSRRRRTPVIQAAEAAECGLACIAMIARHHGHDVDLNGLRQRFSLSLTGATLRALMGMADRLGLSARAVRLELDSLDKLALPAILHWDLNHFVVLTRAGKGRTTVHDPASGRRVVTAAELSKHFTGVALELTPAATFAPVQLRAPMRLSQLWSSLHGMTGVLGQVFVLSAILQVAAFAAPFQLQLVVDEAIYRSDRDLLTVIALGFGGLVLLQAAVQFLRDRTLLIAGSLMGFQVMGNLLRHLMRLPSAFFEKRHLGDILSRIRSSDPIRDAVTKGAIGAVVDGGMALFAAALLFLYSPALAAIVVFAVTLHLGVMLASFPALRSRSREQIVAAAKEQTTLMETLRAAVTIKIMGREAEREAVWRNLYAQVINTGLSIGTLQIATGALQATLMGLQTVAVLYVGGGMVIDGAGFSVGMLIAFLSFRQTFSDRMTSFIGQLVQFRLLGLHLDRLGDIVHAAPDIPEGIAPAFAVMGGIEMRNVAFRYGASDPPVVQDCSLRIPPGAFVAITGRSGCGKSTLLKLMLGLHPPNAGEMLLDGHVASPEIWRAWRDRVGVVAQDDRLLSGSIADNIAFFDPDLRMERVQAAAAAARIHDEILRMPMQYLSLVGDMGSVLSGGQRQRVLLARALYRAPKVLVLDEGTANLDEATESAIAELIASLAMTRVIVAHRPALIRRADTVYVMQDGRLRRRQRGCEPCAETGAA